MLSVTGAATIAEKHQLVTGIYRGLAHLSEADKIRLQSARSLDDSFMFVQLRVKINVEIQDYSPSPLDSAFWEAAVSSNESII